MERHRRNFAELTEKLIKLARLTNAYRNPFFVEDLYQDEREVFFYLTETGPKTMKELAEYVSVKPNVMTSIAARLQEKGMISRSKDKKDRRKSWLRVSPKYQQTYQTYLEDQNKISQLVIETIGEANVRNLTLLLSEALDKINKMPLVNRTV